MTKRSKKPEAALVPNAPVHDQGESVAGIIEHIDGEAGDDEAEMTVLDAGSRKPARTASQSPATRSSLNRHPPQAVPNCLARPA